MANDLHVQVVPVSYAVQTWPMVERFLRDALDVGDESPEWSQCYTLEHVQGFITSGLWQLLVCVTDDGVVKGAATVSYATYPMNRVAFVTLAGGKLICSRDTYSQLTSILKANGATKIQGLGRPSIVRLWRRFGFEPRATLFEARIP